MTTVDFAASLFKHYRNYLWSITGAEYTKIVWSDENIIPTHRRRLNFQI